MCDWVEISKALLTPLLGVIVIYIAWQQWQTNRNKLKLELFDKRFIVFNATRQVLSVVLRDGTTNDISLEEFRVSILDASFLFDGKMHDYLFNLYKIGCKEKMYKRQLEDVPVGEKRNKLADDNMKCVESLTDELKSIQEKFSSFLKLSH